MVMEIWCWMRERVEVEVKAEVGAGVHLAPAQQDQPAIILMKKRVVKTQLSHPHHMKRLKSKSNFPNFHINQSLIQLQF
jgi:hypothetical protein